MFGRLSTERLARASASRPWTVIILWVALFITAGALSNQLFAESVTSEFNLIGTHESKQAKELLEERLRGPRQFADIAIVKSETITVDDPAFREAVDAVVGGVQALGPEIVEDIETFYDNGEETQVSDDRRATFFQVALVGDLTTATTNVEEVHHALDDLALPAGFEVFITGQSTLGAEFTVTAEEDLVRGETFGGLIAIVILTIVFGAVAAMVLPMVLAIVAIVIATGTAALVGQVFELNLFVQNIITMIGLAVGIDYSLFIVSRFRGAPTRPGGQGGRRRRRGNRKPGGAVQRYDGRALAYRSAYRAVHGVRQPWTGRHLRSHRVGVRRPDAASRDSDDRGR